VSRFLRYARLFRHSVGPAATGDSDSVTVCPFTTDSTQAPLFRLDIESTAGNGLRRACRLMVDRITTVSRTKLGTRIGVLDGPDAVRLERAVVLFLGIAATS
jgi:mRNA interferase MazF